jgi:AcrR family transcriptional regulator
MKIGAKPTGSTSFGGGRLGPIETVYPADMNSAKTPDPRVSRTRAAVREAVRELFETEGAASLTHHRVAKHSGVGRATIYRHWPDTVDLLSEALATIDEPLLRLGPGPLRAWLRRELIRFADVLSQPVSLQFLAAIVASGNSDERIAALRDDLNSRMTQTLATKIKRSKRELVDGIDPSLLLLQLVGPIILQVSVLRRPADRAFITHIVDVALDEHT